MSGVTNPVDQLYALGVERFLATATVELRCASGDCVLVMPTDGKPDGKRVQVTTGDTLNLSMNDCITPNRAAQMLSMFRGALGAEKFASLMEALTALGEGDP